MPLAKPDIFIEPEDSSLRPRRPEYNDLEVWSNVCADLLPDIVTWFDPSTPDVHRITSELMSVLSNKRRRFDGYALASDLDEQYGWPVDASLVAIIQRRDSKYPFILRKTIAEWVLAKGIRSPVCVKDSIKFDYIRRPYFGEVTFVDPLQACVVVKFNGLDGKVVDNLRVPFERIESITREGVNIPEPMRWVEIPIVEPL